jgi:hypothetical protein
VKARALRFDHASALTAAITSGLVPAAVAARPARVWREAEGAIRVAPAAPLAKEIEAALARAGARAGEAPAGGVEVTCWAEILPPHRAPEPADLDEVVFVAPDEASVLALAGEILRLGCDRQELGIAGDRLLLRALGPPYYAVARALDRAGGLRAFTGAGGVLTEIGYAHPFAGTLRPAEGHLLFIDGDGRFTQLPFTGAWRSVYEHVKLVLPAPAPSLAPRAPAGTLEVALRLARAHRGVAPSLWVVREDAEAQLDALVRALPDEILERLLFAVATTSEGATLVVLKARPGPGGPPEIALRAAGHAPVVQIANLFAPVDTVLDPPLRSEVVRKLLAPDPDVITWIEPAASGALTSCALPASAFTPLADWVEYVIEGGARAIEPWIRGVTFAFEEFESIGGEWDDAADHVASVKSAAKDESRSAKRRGKARAPEPERAPAAPALAPEPTPVAQAMLEPLVVTPHTPAPRVEELAAIERRFLDLDAPADAPARRPLWLEMARINADLGRRRDAGLCWTRAIWDAPEIEAREITRRWAEAEARAEGSDLAGLLALPAPGADAIRAVAALASAAGEALRPRVAEVSAFLDRRDDDLDVRSLWLARLALSHAVGGDRLGLTRAHDRVLAKLHRGLSIDRDVPTFLRFVGRGERGESTAIVRLARELGRLHERFVATPRARSSVEAPLPLTRAYVDFTFAYGFARLGEIDRARRLADAAAGALDLADPVHGFLARTYRERVKQAVEGAPLETALPADLTGALNGLERFLRYKVDRLRQSSTILEPQERLDPMLAFHRGDRDPRGAELEALRGETSRARLGAEVARLFPLAQAAAPEDRARLFDGLMDFFPQLPESQAVPYLEEIAHGLAGIAAPRRAQLLEEALMLAGHFGRAELVRRLVAQIEPLFAELGPEHVGEAASTIAAIQRALRRVGLKAEAAHLVDALRAAAKGKGTPMLLARLSLAGASFALGEPARAAIDEALAALGGELMMADRLQIARGVARAVAHAPEDLALATLARLADGLRLVTDSFNTNSHFCLSLIAFMESLVLGYAAEDLALGDVGRQWLDDDEVLVRRRVHRDLASMT